MHRRYYRKYRNSRDNFAKFLAFITLIVVFGLVGLYRTDKLRFFGWIFVIAIIIAFFIWFKRKIPTFKGQMGESFVSKKLHTLDSAKYKILNDIMLPSSGNSSATQIDHIVVSNFGIFCIETKTYVGWIFGDSKDQYWTQVIYHHKERFYNPMRQNFGHIKAVESIIGIQHLKTPIVSFIAFPDAGKLKISGTDSVGYARDIIQKIQSYKTEIYTDSERDEIVEVIRKSNIIDKELRKLHNKEVRMLKG